MAGLLAGRLDGVRQGEGLPWARNLEKLAGFQIRKTVSLP